MKKTILPLAATILLSLSSYGQVVNVTDVNFKNFLLNNVSINTNGDMEIQESEALAYTGYMECSNIGISNMNGIEAFVNMTGLNCSDNQLSSLNVSANTALTQLRCYNNQLTSLDITNNTALIGMSCAVNQITSLDVSQNTLLESLACSQNELTTIDVSNNTALEWLWCGTNEMTSIDVSQNVALTNFYCGGNEITSLDLSNNAELVSVYCFDNQLTELDVTNNTLLIDLLCSQNSIVSINASFCSLLGTLDCSSNALTELDLANGNNVNMESILADGNPDLTCIQVDNVAYSTANWLIWDFSFPTDSQFSENCGFLATEDQGKILELEIYPMPINNHLTVQVSEDVDYHILSVDGKSVQSGYLIAGANQLQLNNLSKGSYILQLTKSNRLISLEKILKM
ncbi:MAG: T9SS type A sorting domain-containing protein [Crocinitomicaceae bacterium]|nr:T9SS type A sorting domain-containing protein [Crocinitomicaceae bacterium]